MWHEARKQERRIRGLIVDYRRRAERRQDFYEKIQADPTQFIQIHGRRCKIHLDPAVAAAGDGAAIMQPLVKFKSHLYYEDKDKIQETLKTLRLAPGSKIEFFKNGQSQGVAFSDIFAGSYYPTISIHKSATVSVNFGPTLKYPEILTNYKAKAMFDRAEELICEQSLSDVLYLTENEGRLRLDNFNI